MASYNFDSDYEMEENSGDLDMSLESYQEEQEEQNVQHDELTPSILDSETASSSKNTGIKKRSWVWTHFTFNENIKKAQCNICKAFVVTNKGSTSGMSKHLKNKHPLTIQKKKTQLTLQETILNIPIPVSYI